MKLSKTIIILASWLILIASILYINFIPEGKPVPLRKAFLYFPFELGEWQGKEQTSSDYLATYLGADDILIREYKNKEGEKVELYLAYFEYTKKDKTPHAPQLCWVGSGWSFKSLGDEMIILNDEKSPRVPLKKILAQKNGSKILMFYSYRINRRYVADLLEFRIINVLDSIVKRRNSAFTFQLSAKPGGESLDKKEKLLTDFLQEALSALEEEFLP